jgi:hypothetical protein
MMLSRLYLFAGALCVSSYALAASPSIGSVTARGETKIDNYEVRGSGTLFDGSVVETGQSVSSGADLRLAGNAEITLLRDSRGTLYRDRLVLQRGTAQLGLTDSFRVQASGVLVVPVEEHSSGIVSIDAGNAVTVEARNGTLEIRDSSGAGIARVRPGHPLTFSSVNDKLSGEFSANGVVTAENGHYYLSSSDTGMRYEIKGDNLQSYDGSPVFASGLLEAAAPGTEAAGLLLASSIQSWSSGLPLLGQSAQTRAVVRGLSISLAATSNTTRVCPPDPLVECCPGLPSPLCCNPLPTSECTHSQ